MFDKGVCSHSDILGAELYTFHPIHFPATGQLVSSMLFPSSSSETVRLIYTQRQPDRVAHSIRTQRLNFNSVVLIQ